jgi:hypothetical protein
MPQVDSGEAEPSELEDEGFDGEDFGGYDYEGWDLEEGDDDDPSLALPLDVPSDAWPWDLIEPSLENGEAFLPDSPPEEAALVLAEPLPEPAAPELPGPEAVLPELVEEPSTPEGESLEEPSMPEGEPPELAEEPEPEEEPPELTGEPSPEEPPEPALPPPPPRIVRPSEPIPPPPPAREPLPMPPKAVPDLPARNPPTLAPAPEPAGVSSRIVRALAGQTVEVPFRGSGWVYLGESSSQRGVDYVSRRLDSEGQTFVFRAVEAGTYELKFYRQDFIRDYIINDMVTVIVGEPSLSAPPRFGAAEDRGVAVAEPRWPTLAGRTAPGDAAPGLQAAPAARAAPVTQADPPALPAVAPATPPAAGSSGAPVAEGGAAESPAVEPSPALPQDTATEEYLRRAREEYEGERYPQSMAILDQFLTRFPLGSDEAYWLYAQVCEKQGPSRNIRLALDYYRRLVAEYPQSSHYNDARRRIAYLERYYINIQ